jgi:hypothetical protein
MSVPRAVMSDHSVRILDCPFTANTCVMTAKDVAQQWLVPGLQLI